MNIQILYERRAAAYEAARTLNESTDDLTEEQQAEFDTALADVDDLTAQIGRSERMAANEKLVTAVVDSGIGHGSATPDNERELRAAFGHYLRTGDPVEYRALNVGTGSAGGFTVPEGFRAVVIETLKAFGGVRSEATTIVTATGNDLPFPTMDDTTNKGVILAENAATTQQDVVFDEVILKAHKYSSKEVRYSSELAQDTFLDLESFLARALGERIGRIQADHFATGSGTGEPEGVFTNATTGVTLATGQTTDFASADDGTNALIDLVHSVDPAYRPGSVFVMNDTTLSKVRKLKDADGRSIWVPSFEEGASDRLLGHRVVTDQSAPAWAASTDPILFGNVRLGYVVRDVSDLRVLVLNELYAGNDQSAVIAFLRSDGQPQLDDAYRVMTASAT